MPEFVCVRAKQHRDANGLVRVTGHMGNFDCYACQTDRFRQLLFDEARRGYRFPGLGCDAMKRAADGQLRNDTQVWRFPSDISERDSDITSSCFRAYQTFEISKRCLMSDSTNETEVIKILQGDLTLSCRITNSDN
jgi:hypothetical protein